MRRTFTLVMLLFSLSWTVAHAVKPEHAARLQGEGWCVAAWEPTEAGRTRTAQQCIDELFGGKCGPGVAGSWAGVRMRTAATGLEVSWSSGDAEFWEPLTPRDAACRYPLWLGSPPSTGAAQSADCAIATTALQKTMETTGCQVDTTTGLLMHREGRTRDFLCQGLNYVDRYGIYMGQACRCAPGIRRGDYSLEQMQRLAVTNCASMR